MLTQIKVYITAKREHGEKILKSIPDGFHCNARWIYMLHTPERPVTHWLRENFDDAITANFVLFYVEPGDKLKTSLIELGHALAYGKQIFIASDVLMAHDGVETIKLPHKDLEPWAAFNSISYTGSLHQTFKYIRNLYKGYKINNKGLTEEQQEMADRNGRSSTT